MQSTKSILVSNNHLDQLGGSETFTYSMIKTLKEEGFDVEYFTFHKGVMSEAIETELDVKFLSKKEFDVIFANHRTTVDFLLKEVKGKIIQTCHGIYPPLEQPHRYADGYVAISNEVSEHLKNKGYHSKIILNGVDCDRFYAKKAINKKLKNVLSLSQSESANRLIQEACEELDLNFMKINKHVNPIWNVEDIINKSDVVIGLGRSAYEAMACGRPVIIFDERAYSESYADGYITENIIDNSILNNCSGRFYKLKLDKKGLINELKKYSSDDGMFFRNFALENLNSKTSINTYINYSESIRINSLKRTRFKIRILKKKLKSFFKNDATTE